MEDMKDKYVFPNRIKPTNEEFRAYKLNALKHKENLLNYLHFFKSR